MCGACPDSPSTQSCSDFIMDKLKAVLRCHPGFEFNHTHTEDTRKSATSSDLIQKPPLKASCVNPLVFPTQIHRGRVSLEGEHAVHTQEWFSNNTKTLKYC